MRERLRRRGRSCGDCFTQAGKSRQRAPDARQRGVRSRHNACGFLGAQRRPGGGGHDRAVAWPNRRAHQFCRRGETFPGRYTHRGSLASGNEFKILSLHPCNRRCTPRHDRAETRRDCQHHRDGRQIRVADASLRRSCKLRIDAGHSRLGKYPWKIWHTREWDQSRKHVDGTPPRSAETRRSGTGNHRSRSAEAQ